MAAMSLHIDQAVAKAEERADDLGGNLQTLAAHLRETPPAEIASPAEKRQRRKFLEELYGSDSAAQTAFERIIAGNELQDANYLARGAVAARTIMRIVLRNANGATVGYGSGFLVGNGVLITNNHVLGGPDAARHAQAEAFFERSATGIDLTPWSFALKPEQLFYTSKALDFTLVAVSERDRTGRSALASLGWLPLLGEGGKAMEGEWLTIIQHPNGERKQVCVRENQLLKRDKDVLWYSTDTLGGSSGSAVLNNDWLVVALHHSGVPEMKDGRWQTIDGRDYDPTRDGEDRIKWIANEGIRVSRIVETLRADVAISRHPMVAPILSTGVGAIDARLPVLFAAGQSLPDLLSGGGAGDVAGRQNAPPVVASASTRNGTAASPVIIGSQQSGKREAGMARQITLNLLIDDDGRVSLLHGGATESALLGLEGTAAKKKKDVIDAPVDPARDWINGYDPDFLGTGNLRVNLPIVTQTNLIAPLKAAYGQTFDKKRADGGVLHYDRYSIVMNKERRFAFFSAANVSWDMRPGISGRTDNWLFDDRIARNHQVDNSYYKHNKFDRGHLTRREDMEWGNDSVSSVRRANGTCTWTNCTPQHEIFNQDKSPDPTIRLWQGLERYILEERAEQGKFHAQVITGPVFGGADPVYRDIAYPLEFWKVVVAVAESGKLFATAYLLSQKATIDQHGLETTPVEPFGAYELYQRPIALIEDLTALEFTYGAKGESLSQCDPLATPQGRARQSRLRANTYESSGVGSDQLTSFEQIVLY